MKHNLWIWMLMFKRILMNHPVIEFPRILILFSFEPQKPLHCDVENSSQPLYNCSSSWNTISHSIHITKFCTGWKPPVTTAIAIQYEKRTRWYGAKLPYCPTVSPNEAIGCLNHSLSSWLEIIPPWNERISFSAKRHLHLTYNTSSVCPQIIDGIVLIYLFSSKTAINLRNSERKLQNTKCANF